MNKGRFWNFALDHSTYLLLEGKGKRRFYNFLDKFSKKVFQVEFLFHRLVWEICSYGFVNVNNLKTTIIASQRSFTVCSRSSVALIFIPKQAVGKPAQQYIA